MARFLVSLVAVDPPLTQDHLAMLREHIPVELSLDGSVVSFLYEAESEAVARRGLLAILELDMPIMHIESIKPT